jgi:hypothetical protein
MPDAVALSVTALPTWSTFDDWKAAGVALAERAKRVAWEIGDWWSHGQHQYGERAAVAAEGIFGRSFKTLANYGSVARAIETSRRREALSFKHHAEVAAQARNGMLASAPPTTPIPGNPPGTGVLSSGVLGPQQMAMHQMAMQGRPGAPQTGGMPLATQKQQPPQQPQQGYPQQPMYGFTPPGMPQPGFAPFGRRPF